MPRVKEFQKTSGPMKQPAVRHLGRFDQWVKHVRSWLGLWRAEHDFASDDLTEQRGHSVRERCVPAATADRQPRVIIQEERRCIAAPMAVEPSPRPSRLIPTIAS